MYFASSGIMPTKRASRIRPDRSVTTVHTRATARQASGVLDIRQDAVDLTLDQGPALCTRGVGVAGDIQE